MQYTVWSRGRLLGETDLGFIYRENRHRCGWFHPNDLGEQLMPAAVGVAPAMRVEWAIGPDETARADILAAVDREQALELELRGPNGKRIETEDIGIIDTHYLLALADNDRDERDMEELTAEQQAEIDSMVEEWIGERELEGEGFWSDEDVEFPRYQIQIRLIDNRDIP